MSYTKCKSETNGLQTLLVPALTQRSGILSPVCICQQVGLPLCKTHQSSACVSAACSRTNRASKSRLPFCGIRGGNKRGSVFTESVHVWRYHDRFRIFLGFFFFFFFFCCMCQFLRCLLYCMTKMIVYPRYS